MKLFEFEGHSLLKRAGIASPFFVVCKNITEVKKARDKFKFPLMAKVQVLSGRRGKSGGVVEIKREAQLLDFAKEHFGKEFPSAHWVNSGQVVSGGASVGKKVRFITLVQKVDFKAQYYISITYDTVKRVPSVIFSEHGGVEVEEQADENIIRTDIDPVIGPQKAQFKKWPVDIDFMGKLWKVFVESDARLVEINPLVKTEEGSLIALDAKIVLDDNGFSRHEDIDVLPKGVVSSEPTARELEAKKIDEADYRGSAGSAFIEMDGDIAIMASGGGASLLVMDSLIAAGGSPANYTEYSGNPSRDKVEKLTRVVLSKSGLCGCLVAGAIANFTDIFETLSGFAAGLKSIKPKPTYPIVIRRGGPRQEEAYKMLQGLAKKEGFQLYLYGPDTPISVAAKEMVRFSEEYKSRNSKSGVRNKV